MLKVVIFTPGKLKGGGMSSVAEDHYLNLLESGIDAVLIETSSNSFLGKMRSFFKAILYSFFIIVSCGLDGSKDLKFVFHVASRNSFYRKYFIWLFVRAFNAKAIVHLHGGQFIDFYNDSGFVIRHFIKSFFLNSSLVIVLGSKWKNWLVDSFNLTNIEVLPNGIVLDDIPEGKLSNDKIYDFVFVGRVEEKKGARELVLALNLPFFSRVKAVFVGDVLDNSIVSLCKNPGVSFAGQVSRSEVEMILSQSRFFVLPSYFEAFPLSILEAQKFGCVVITTPVGSIPDIVDDNINGFLVAPGNVHELACKLKYVYENHDLLHYIVSNARDRLFQYELKCIVRKLKSLYENT